MKISEMIDKLQEIKNEHGDLEIYEYNTEWASVEKYKDSLTPRVAKIYSQKWEDFGRLQTKLRLKTQLRLQNQLIDGDLDKNDEDLYDVDLNKPIVKGVII